MTCTITFEATGEAPTLEALEAFLSERRWYESAADGASYANEDTGVKFDLGWSGGGEGVGAIRFRMPFLRPRFFGLEAAGELEALVAEFELAPRAPADAGGGEELGSFEAEEFLKGYERGTRAAVDEAESSGDLPSYRDDPERLRDFWRWNRARKDYQTVLGEGVFVPALRLLAEGDELRRACVWPETIPVALPASADLVLLSGLEAEGLTSGSSDLRVADAEAVVDVIGVHAERIDRRSDPTRHVLVGWATPPPELLEELVDLGAPAEERGFERVSPDAVLDDDLID